VGFAKTGERYTDPRDSERLTDDLRCRRCGKRALCAKIMHVVEWAATLPEGAQLPEGARLLKPGVWECDAHGA
jgi:hypothetical protein